MALTARDGSDDQQILYLGYVPEVAPAAVFAVLFGLLFLCHLIHLVRHKRMLFWLWMLLGLAGETAGCIERLLMHYSPYSFGLFLAQIFCLVLSPVFFAGVNYVLFSRLSRNRMQQNVRFHRWTSYAFIASDILTFLIQSAGGSLFASNDYNTNVIGGKILLSGLCLQLASIVGFCLWMAISDFRVIREGKDLGTDYKAEWNRIRIARWISITGILIRGIYRILEYAQGQDGYLLIHEAFLYSLDSAPIFVATAIFVVPGFFPGKLLSMKPYRSREESIEMDHAIATI